MLDKRIEELNKEIGVEMVEVVDGLVGIIEKVTELKTRLKLERITSSVERVEKVVDKINEVDESIVTNARHIMSAFNNFTACLESAGLPNIAVQTTPGFNTNIPGDHPRYKRMNGMGGRPRPWSRDNIDPSTSYSRAHETTAGPIYHHDQPMNTRNPVEELTSYLSKQRQDNDDIQLPDTSNMRDSMLNTAFSELPISIFSMLKSIDTGTVLDDDALEYFKGNRFTTTTKCGPNIGETNEITVNDGTLLRNVVILAFNANDRVVFNILKD